MDIHLPEDIAEHEGDIRFFVDCMIRKLAANSHKGWATKHDVASMCAMIGSEHNELIRALEVEGQFEAFMEAVDVANMALLTGMAVSKQTRKEFDEAKPDTVDPKANYSTLIGKTTDRGFAERLTK